MYSNNVSIAALQHARLGARKKAREKVQNWKCSIAPAVSVILKPWLWFYRFKGFFESD